MARFRDTAQDFRDGFKNADQLKREPSIKMVKLTLRYFWERAVQFWIQQLVGEFGVQ